MPAASLGAEAETEAMTLLTLDTFKYAANMKYFHNTRLQSADMIRLLYIKSASRETKLPCKQHAFGWRSMARHL